MPQPHVPIPPRVIITKERRKHHRRCSKKKKEKSGPQGRVKIVGRTEAKRRQESAFEGPNGILQTSSKHHEEATDRFVKAVLILEVTELNLLGVAAGLGPEDYSIGETMEGEVRQRVFDKGQRIQSDSQNKDRKNNRSVSTHTPRESHLDAC